MDAKSLLFVGLGIDWRVLGFTSGVALLSCLLFGLLPAVRATKVAPASVMRAGGRGLTGGREKFSARRFLVVAQVALSLVLLVGALLFVTSLQKLLRVDPGFRAEGLISVDLNMQRLQIAPQARATAFKPQGKFELPRGVGRQVRFGRVKITDGARVVSRKKVAMPLVVVGHVSRIHEHERSDRRAQRHRRKAADKRRHPWIPLQAARETHAGAQLP